MIVACLFGGLGNQMFQYAAARAVALRLGVPLKLDVTRFDGYANRLLDTKRAYALGHFAIVAELAAPKDLVALRRTRLGLLLQRLLPQARRTHVRERHFHFDPRLDELRAPAYLDGYWQSEKYFAGVAEKIRAELTVKTPPAGENARLLRLIESGESVAVHVRRGDYVSEPSGRRVHGSCTPDYYRRAVGEIGRRVREARFFVFSDDPAWTRANLRIEGPVAFVDHNGPERHYEDMRLMSRCRHHIIANSSFGWWGAWLGAHPGQTVVAPSRWFASGSRETRDLYPPRWLRM